LDQATSATGMMEEVGTASASPIEDFLIDLHQRISDVGGGKVAEYIPELGRADADTFGMALATVDGETYATGDADHLFLIFKTFDVKTHRRLSEIHLARSLGKAAGVADGREGS
jgi:Glutaminase